MDSSSATVFEYMLNFQEKTYSSYFFIEDVIKLFQKRCKEMRDGIVSSPRGIRAKEANKQVPPLRQPYILREQKSTYCIMFERFTAEEREQDVIPKNLFATRRLGQDFYGIVMVFQIPAVSTSIQQAVLDISFEFDKENEAELKDSLQNGDTLKSYSFISDAS